MELAVPLVWVDVHKNGIWEAFYFYVDSLNCFLFAAKLVLVTSFSPHHIFSRSLIQMTFVTKPLHVRHTQCWIILTINHHNAFRGPFLDGEKIMKNSRFYLFYSFSLNSEKKFDLWCIPECSENIRIYFTIQYWSYNIQFVEFYI